MDGELFRRGVRGVEMPAHEARPHRCARKEQYESPDHAEMERVGIDRAEVARGDAVLDDRPRRREELEELGENVPVESSSARQVLAENDGRKGGALGGEPGERPDEGLEPRLGRRLRLADPGEPGPDVAQALPDDLHVQLLFSPEVVGDQRRVRPRVASDRVDRRSVEAMPREPRGSGREDAGPGAFGVARHGVRLHY